MTYASTVVADSPYIYYKLNEASGATTVVDSSGNARDGTVHGSLTNRATAPDATANGAFGFSSSSDYILSNANYSSPSTVTVEAWVYVPSGTIASNINIVCSGYSSNSSADEDLYIDTTGAVYFYNANVGQIGGIMLPRNRWVHVVGTVGTVSGTCLYVDGIRYAQNSQTSSPTYGSLYFSVHSPFSNLAGFGVGGAANIAHVAIYTTELSATAIQAHYSAMGVVNPSTSTTPVRVYEEYAELLVLSVPPIRVYEEYVELLVLSKPPIRVYEEYVELLVSFPPAGAVGVAATLTLTAPVPSQVGAFQPGRAVGPAASVTLAAPPGSIGRIFSASDLSVSVVAPAGGVEAYTIDRSGDVLNLTLVTTDVPAQPGSLTVSIGNGAADSTAYIYFQDGSGIAVLMDSVVLDDFGQAISVAVPVNNLAVGSHTIGVSTSGSVDPTAWQTFTVSGAVVVDPGGTPVDPPTPPAPGPTVTYWQFRDYTDYSISYTFTTNPMEFITPAAQIPLAVDRSTAANGEYIMFEGSAKAPIWTFSGRTVSEAEVLAIQEWTSKTQRVYVLDHFSRRMTVRFEGTADFVRVKDFQRPWHHTYTVRMHVLKVE